MLSPEVVAERIARLVHVQLGRATMVSAGIRLRIYETSHRLEVATVGGKFSSSDLVTQVDVALSMFFSELLVGLTTDQRKELRATVASVIRERHEGQLPKAPDPRRLPLLLPKLGPSTEARAWRRTVTAIAAR